jgi:ribosomal protein S18 acetylase RimI-like enzyme
MVNLLVTYMEMLAPPAGAAMISPTTGAGLDKEELDVQQYLRLYRDVGGPVQWDQRLRMSEVELCGLLKNHMTHIYVLRLHARPVGLCEYVGVGSSDVELTNFGLIPAVQGRKLGPYLLDWALRSVWAIKPQRVWLHTDTNDHPKAQSVYERIGFKIYEQRVESFPD